MKTGFTTGASAAAAAKAAVLSLFETGPVKEVEITFLNGAKKKIPIEKIRKKDNHHASATVIKDAGDDPDITHRARIGATVTLLPVSGRKGSVRITGGKGVGVVTKPGLGIREGGSSITQGPVRMITASVNEALSLKRASADVRVTVFVPEGEKLAKKTLNARLGIIGGISILGTTGIVYPMSHDAYIATIEKAMAVASATGSKTVVLTTGRRSERFAQMLFPKFAEEAFIQIGDFFKHSLELASRKHFSKVILAVFFGKAVKMACGTPHTHAAKSELALSTLSEWTFDVTENALLAEEVGQANTARHAFDMIKDTAPQVVACVGQKIIGAAGTFSGPGVEIDAVIFDFDGKVVFDSNW